MDYHIAICTKGGAFGDDPEFELARMLRVLADSLEREGAKPKVLHDLDGKPAGAVKVLEDKRARAAG